LRIGEHIYGSDQHGLIWGYRFGRERAVETIDSEAALGFLASTEQRGASEFVWLHFSLANSAPEAWLRSNLQLPEAFFESRTGRAVPAAEPATGLDCRGRRA